MKKIILSIIICVICLNGSFWTANAEDEPKLYAKAAVLMDGDTGRVLYGKEEQLVLPMASTTKIMTLILALEYGNLDDILTVSDYAAKMPDVQLGIKAGERYRLEDLLYSMMLESHNDSAVAVAEHIGGSVEGFADMMNRKAEEIGLSHTYFITPNGLDAQDTHGIHSTTAKDLALLMRYCVFLSEQKDMFQKICQTRSYSFSDREEKRQFFVVNKNALLDQMDGVLAGKTGFTGNAGYCYVACVKINGKHFIVSLLACGWPHNKHYKWADTKALLRYGDENFSFRTIHMDEIKINPIPVEDGLEKNIRAYATGSVSLLMKAGERLQIKTNFDNDLRAPVRYGDTVGCIRLEIGDTQICTFPIFAAQEVDKKDFSYYIYRVFDEFFCGDTF